MSRRLDRLFERVLRSDYYKYQELEVAVRGKKYKLISKMGLPGWPKIDFAAQLMAENVTLRPDARVANIGCGSGLIGVVASALVPDGEVLMVDSDYLAIEAARRTARLNEAHTAQALLSDGLTALEERQFDAVLINLPQSKELVYQYLGYAHHLLGLGGQLYLAGVNRAGIKNYSRVVEQVFGNMQVLLYRQGHRLVRATKTAPDIPAHMPWIADLLTQPEQQLPLQIRGNHYTVITKPGVFSRKQLDRGSAVLLEVMQIDATDRVLDLGCGYGVLGLVAAGLAAQGFVYLVDSNISAVNAAAQTLQYNQVNHATALLSDVISEIKEIRFDVVVTNPPFHAGVETDFATPLAFIAGSAEVLKPGGRLYLVANQFIKYEPYIERLFTATRTVYKDNQFKVVEAIK